MLGIKSTIPLMVHIGNKFTKSGWVCIAAAAAFCTSANAETVYGECSITTIAEQRHSLVHYFEYSSTDAMIDAAAVIVNFQRMVRIADGSGIPLDAPMAMITAEIRDELGINEFSSANLTQKVGPVKRVLGKVMAIILPVLFRRMAKAK